MPPRPLRSTIDPSDQGPITPAPPSPASSATPSVDSTLTEASTIQQEYHANTSASPHLPLDQPAAATTNAQSNVTTGEFFVLNKLLDMVAALQKQVNNLQQERVIHQQSARTIPFQREETLPPDDEEHLGSTFGTPPLDQPAIRDEPAEAPIVDRQPC